MELKIRYICINISDLNSLLLVHFQSLNKIEYNISDRSIQIMLIFIARFPKIKDIGNKLKNIKTIKFKKY